MTLRPVTTTSLADQVFGALLAEIAGGSYPSGAALPSERALTGLFAVNRHVVREALKRLEQIGLVRTTQGGGTRVLDFRRTAGLDLLALMAEHADVMEGLLPLLGAAMEMRSGIGVDVARLCALRAGDVVHAELQEISEELATVAAGPQLVPLDRRFWQAMLDGADNFAYQLAFNSLIRGVDAVPELSADWLQHELQRCDYRRPIAAAIAAGDGDGAARAAQSALALPADLLLAAGQGVAAGGTG